MAPVISTRAGESPLPSRPELTGTTVAVLALTPRALGSDPDGSGSPAPLALTSVAEAFEKAAPQVDFSADVAGARFRVALRPRALRDFAPDAVLAARDAGGPNDVAELDARLTVLAQVREKLAHPRIAQLWDADASQRSAVVDAVRELQGRVNGAPAPAAAASPSPPPPRTAPSGRQVSQAVRDIFGDDSAPAAAPATGRGAMEPEPATSYLARMADATRLVDATLGHAAVVRALDDRLRELTAVRDSLLRRLYAVLRPLERSYRLVHLFFENARVASAATRDPIELHVVDADAGAIRDAAWSAAARRVGEFLQRRSDSPNLRAAVNHLVVSGHVPDAVRRAFAETAAGHGVLLVGDLGDDASLDEISHGFRASDGRYAFLDAPGADVTVAASVRLRDAHPFEEERDGLYGPGSLPFAGVLARVVRGGGQELGPVRGVSAARFALASAAERERLPLPRRLFALARGADGDFHFVTRVAPGEDPQALLTPAAAHLTVRAVEQRLAELVARPAAAAGAAGAEGARRAVHDAAASLLEGMRRAGLVRAYDLEVVGAPPSLGLRAEVVPAGSDERYAVTLGAASDDAR